MTNTQIKQLLLSRGVHHLYHTNTVATSLSFLQNGGLLSRGLCNDMHLPQTEQYTDKLDQDYDIFYDIFFDSIEIQRITGISYYGPVLFEYNIDVLDIVNEGDIRVSKMNPQKWRKTSSENERYFNDYETLAFCYDPYDFGQHIMLKNQTKSLPFDFLEKIVLSNPQQDENSLFESAKTAIEDVIDDEWIDVPLLIRDYNYNDRFFETYKNREKLNKHYSIGGFSL